MPLDAHPYFWSRIENNNMKFKGLLVLGAAVNACSGPQGVNEEQLAQMQRVDSLWGRFKSVKELLRYDVWTINERRQEMDSLLQITRFFKSEDLNDAEKQLLVGYAAIARVYKPTAPKYGEIVLESEERFYSIKALEQSVKNNTYSGKKDAFLESYNEEKDELIKLEEEGKSVLSRLSEVEPMYERLHPAVEELMNRKQPKDQK